MIFVLIGALTVFLLAKKFQGTLTKMNVFGAVLLVLALTAWAAMHGALEPYGIPGVFAPSGALTPSK